jgi:hypothetical protein
VRRRQREDDADVRQFVAAPLRDLGYAVIEAADKRQARKLREALGEDDWAGTEPRRLFGCERANGPYADLR